MDYVYGGYSVPYAVRVRAELQHVTDPAAYEGFTCLVAGSRYEKGKTNLDRDEHGRLIYAWKRDTPPLSFDQQNELIAAGKLKRDEAWLHLEDIETGKPARPHAGSVCWNEYRKRWVMIVEESGGTSMLGEIWYAEADTPVGPWVYARKIVTHDKYSFYNPTQHPFFDQAGGRLIYFEGTYSDLFSGSPEKTPRYDYNQIMYRLALDDPRLFLPVSVYRVRDGIGGERPGGYLQREAVESQNAWDRIEEIPFFALPPERRREGTIPVLATVDQSGVRLRRAPQIRGGADKQPLFNALPAAGPTTDAKSSLSIVPLFEYSRRDGGPYVYSTAAELADEALVRSSEPLCRVWRNPMSLLLLDRGVQAK